jgi:hypothetical protein
MEAFQEVFDGLTYKELDKVSLNPILIINEYRLKV